MITITKTSRAADKERLGAPESFRLTRTTARDVQFRGWLLARASDGGHGTNRWFEVEIYLTTGGNLVGWIGFRSLWVGERETSRAQLFAGHERGDALYRWLADPDEMFGCSEVSGVFKDAWEQACAEWPGLSGQELETWE